MKKFHEPTNLTLLIVDQEIKNVLTDYPKYPYRAAFAIHELRQQLVAAVLNQISNRYIVEGTQELTTKSGVPRTSSLEERAYMNALIRGGIVHFLQANADLIERHLQRSTSSSAGANGYCSRLRRKILLPR